MKIKEESILKVFKIFSNVYQEFNKRIEDYKKMEEMIKAWKEVFETIEFDYENANRDFIEGAKRAVSKSKYTPTIAEISEEMKNIYKARIEKEREIKRMQIWKIEEICDLRSGNLEKTIKNYNKLKEKYSDEEIIKQIQEYKKKQNLRFAILETEETFEKIME